MTEIENNIETQAQTKACPCCGEEININAIKCKHCGEFLNGEHPRSGVKLSLSLNEQQKKLATKILHVASLWACTILAISGCGMLFASQINIADGAIYTAMWTGAIFFLLVWKLTETE